jgi:hypothetical protein
VLGRVERESADVVGLGRVAHKAAGGVGEETEHEEKRQVMGVPERLETLLADFVVSGTVHQDLLQSQYMLDRMNVSTYHDEEHDMAGETSGLGVVDLQRGLRADL